jgi:hypothetical protein
MYSPRHLRETLVDPNELNSLVVEHPGPQSVIVRLLSRMTEKGIYGTAYGLQPWQVQRRPRHNYVLQRQQTPKAYPVLRRKFGLGLPVMRSYGDIDVAGCVMLSSRKPATDPGVTGRYDPLQKRQM